MARMEQNVDASEIGKFDAMAAYWWDPAGRLKALHDINGLRVGYIDSQSRLAGKKVLDVGCGGGILAEAMAAAGARVFGIDMGESALEVARAHAEARGIDIDYRRDTVESMARSTTGKFDVVTCLEMLEHVPDPGSVISAIRALLRPGGDVFFATLNRNPKSFLFAILGAEYLLNLVPRGTHTYRKFITPDEMTRWADRAGLARIDMTGLHYNPFLRRYSLGGNLHVNYMAHFRPRSGLSGSAST